MNKEQHIINKTKLLIDDLKSICSRNGIGNSPSEYKIISQIFLYKYLNDRFIYEVKKVNNNFDLSTTIKEVEIYLRNLEPKDYQLLTMKMDPNVAKVKKEYLISYLYNNQNITEPQFYELFDNTLNGISNDNIDIFSVKTGSEEKIKLFDNLSQYILEEELKNKFFKAIINKLVDFSFEDAFKEKYDFFATIFEYLIKDYNTDYGKYAEYYTPNSIARVIAKILSPNPTQNVSIYDPASGTGTLLLALAHQIGEDNCTIYSQDISQKSNEFLRLNLILNNLVHSLNNVIKGDTLLNPAHLINNNELTKFDYIVSNPPFNVDFSDTRDTLAGENYKERFWAGVPNIPDKDKKSMLIYLMFLQHIINSIEENGKAAIVIPTPFLTKSKGIEMKIRKKLIDSAMLKGVISMPKNIFSNTGTSVSVLFLENNHKNDDKVFFIDATELGIKTSSERNQKTILTEEDQNLIVETYLEKKILDKFSSESSYKAIEKNEYRLSPNTYFSHELEYVKYDNESFNKVLNKEINNLKLYYSNELENVLKLLFNYWFLQFEFPNENGKPYKSSGGKFEFNEDLEIDIPEGWEVVNIQNEVCSIVDCLHSKKPDFKFESEDYYLLQSENITNDGKIDISNKYYISKEDYDFWTSRIEVKENDFVITNAGRAGSIGMLNNKVKCAIGRNMTAIRANTISPYFLRQFLNSPYMSKYVASNLDEGSFFKSFNVKSIKKIMIIIPPKDIEKKYVEFAKPLIDKLLNGLDIESEKEEIKKLLDY